MDNYLEINRKSWNDRVPHHLSSEFYDVQGFLNGKSSLNDIELELLGDVQGKKILHLQCHIGQDSISLSRLGAEVTGIDLSDASIDAARNLAGQCGTDTRFVVSDVYALPENLAEKFDIVFTSYGTIGWLPDLSKWAQVIAHFLKPDGIFVMADFHPFVWMYDDYFKEIAYSYFNVEPIVETVSGTYAERDAAIELDTVGWNHPTSEVLNSLIQEGLEINAFNEYNYSPYNCFRKTEKTGEGRFHIQGFGDKFPYVFAIKATKKPS